LQVLNKTKDQASDIFLASLSTSTEILSFLVGVYVVNIPFFGRRRSMIIFYGISALSSLFVIFDNGAHYLLMATIAKFFINMTFMFLYQYTSEVYPTLMRASGFGLASGVGRIGIIFMS